MKIFGIFAALLLIGLIAPGRSAHAVYVGIAVEGIGSTNSVSVGTPSPTSTQFSGQPFAFTYYIPLADAASGDFGVKGIGVDYCSASSTNHCGGYLDMYLLYQTEETSPSIATFPAGLNSFTFDFVDLDLPGDGINSATRAADNSYFSETVEISIFEESGSGYNNILGSAVSFSMLGGDATGNQEEQHLTVSGNITNSGNIWAHLRFTSDLDKQFGNWRNTPEEMFAWGGPVSVVPLPAALPLYGTGLAVMGLIGWRRKKKLAS